MKEGPVFFLVLNRPDNTLDFEFMDAVDACLNEVEKSTGAACLVTIGQSDQAKAFSTGFNLKKWSSQGIKYQFHSVLHSQQLFARMLTLGIPTICVMNGMTIAGVLLFALMHDFRIMRDDGDKSFVCLSEINVGISLPPGFAAIVKHQLDPQTSRLLMFGGRYNAQ